MNVCSICGKVIEREDAPVLTISGYGNPRYLCDECSGEMDVAMSAREVDEIEAAIKTLGDKMNVCTDDHAVSALYSFIGVACDRRVKIKDGTYDFAIDERMKELAEEEVAFDEIPEELQETEEDKELDRREAEKQKKFDDIMNWVSLIAIGGAVVYLILSFIL